MLIKHFFYSLLIIISFLAGIVLISLQKNLIILNFKNNTLKDTSQSYKSSCFKKNVTLYFWQNEQLKSESNQILWEQDSAKNLTNLIHNWLGLLSEEQIIPDKIKLQAVLLSKNAKTAYLSFDQPLLNKNSSTSQKLLLLESLLKTIRTNQNDIQEVQFLVQHQIMQDPQLNFAVAWPINGFLQI